MYDKRELCKTVKVSDPENWYGRDTVEVKLFICPEYNKKTNVRILIKSIDDFMMEHTRDCYSQADIDATYKQMKQYMFDRLPDEISCTWLFEHGYCEF